MASCFTFTIDAQRGSGVLAAQSRGPSQLPTVCGLLQFVGRGTEGAGTLRGAAAALVRAASGGWGCTGVSRARAGELVGLSVLRLLLVPPAAQWGRWPSPLPSRPTPWSRGSLSICLLGGGAHIGFPESGGQGGQGGGARALKRAGEEERVVWRGGLGWVALGLCSSLR